MVFIVWRRGLYFAGVFYTKHEDQQSGRVWEGIIKYHIGATFDQPNVTPDKRLSVSYHCIAWTVCVRMCVMCTLTSWMSTG